MAGSTVAFTEVLGLTLGGIGATLGIIQTASGLLPERHTEHSRISIAVALESVGGHHSYGGWVDARLFNQNGQLIGDAHRAMHIRQGNSKYQITYKHDKRFKGHQGVYGLFTANDDGICIAWTAVTWPDGTSHMATGDWVHNRLCGGGEWGISNLIAGIHADGPYMPYCIWIDKNGDVSSTAFQVYYPHLAPRQDRSLPKLKNICNLPSFTVYKSPGRDVITYWLNPSHINSIRSNTNETIQDPHSNQQTRPREKRVSRPDTRLILTDKPQHRASELCNSHNSRGPSVVSHYEGKYCDMTTKTLYQLCRTGFEEEESSCFNDTTRSFESADVTGRVVAKRANPFVFTQILDWTG